MSDNPKGVTFPASNSEFLKYFAPLIQALKELGGSATRKDAHEKVVELMGISEEELSVTYEKTGASRVLNQIDFSRNNLAHEGFISSGTKGIWALTELGTSIEMTPELAGLIHMKLVKINTAKRKGEPIPDIDLSKYYKKKVDHKFTKDNFLKDVFITEPKYNKLRSLLLKKNNIILQGAPGVGKTFSAKRLAYSIIGEKNENRICMVQFHQNYSYEDFLMVFDFVDNASQYNMPYSMHRLFRLKKYRPGQMVLGKANERAADEALYAKGDKPEALIDYPVSATDYEAVDIFNWQEEADGMISQIELIRRVDVQSETVERYIREGKIYSTL